MYNLVKERVSGRTFAGPFQSLEGKTKRDLEIDLRASYQCVSMRVMPQPRMYSISTPCDNDYLKYTMWFLLIFTCKVLLLTVVESTRAEYMYVSIRTPDDSSVSSLESRLESAQRGRVLANVPKRLNRWQPDWCMSFDFNEVSISGRNSSCLGWIMKRSRDFEASGLTSLIISSALHKAVCDLLVHGPTLQLNHSWTRLHVVCNGSWASSWCRRCECDISTAPWQVV